MGELMQANDALVADMRCPFYDQPRFNTLCGGEYTRAYQAVIALAEASRMNMVTFRAFAFYKATYEEFLDKPDQEGVRASWMAQVSRLKWRIVFTLLLQNTVMINLQATWAALDKASNRYAHNVDSFVLVSLI